MNTPCICLDLPAWLKESLDHYTRIYPDAEDRVRLVIHLAGENVRHNTGGPFGAAVFHQQSGQLIALGVNTVTRSRCSIAHAEMIALGLAQQALGQHTLDSRGPDRYELATSTEPCAMCLGALPWAGIKGLLCGARGEDAESIGFDEGAKPAQWTHALRERGIAVQRDILREEARAVLIQYRETGGIIY